MYRKFKIEDFLAKNMFLGSNMDFTVPNTTSKEDNLIV